MGTPTQEASRFGLGCYKFSGANGFADSTLLQILTAAGYAGADLPGATGDIKNDPKILTGFDIYILTNSAAIYFRNDGAACTANDFPLDLGVAERVRDTTIGEIKKRHWFSPAGTTFDIRILLWA